MRHAKGCVLRDGIGINEQQALLPGERFWQGRLVSTCECTLSYGIVNESPGFST
jgi:hypothetical protein